MLFTATGMKHDYSFHARNLRKFLEYTAYCFLIENDKLKKGDKVFINVGSDAVGMMAIQLARTIFGPSGLVMTTCPPAESLRERYSSCPFDAIFDTPY